MIKSQFLRFIATVYQAFRLKYWSIFSKEKKVTTLKVLKDEKFKFYEFGDIAKILYSHQHLVKYKKSFEYETLELFRSQLKKGATIIDIGANIGLFSILASKYIGKEGHVFAFEPMEKTFSLLKKNIELNNADNVSCYQYALSNTKGEVIIGPPVDNGFSNFKDSLNFMRDKDREINTTENVVQTCVLDDERSNFNIGKVDLIKIDVEGAELLCLKGSKKILAEDKPSILFEAYEDYTSRFNYKVIDLLTFLHSLDYDIKQLNESQWFAVSK